MVTVKQIRDEIEGFEVNEAEGTINVEFDEYILQIDLKYFKGLEINEDSIAKVIFDEYQ